MIDNEELKNLCERIIRSGELGRSRTYAAILEYLVEHAIAGTTPKEISIAIDVLGRDPTFDVSKDAIVRVHIYHLRNKVNGYFSRQGAAEKYRLEIPKGQYTLAVTENPVGGTAAADEAATEATSITGQPLQRRNYTPYLAAFAIFILGLNLFNSWRQPAAAPVNPFAGSQLWQPLLDDNEPILILLGDYYIMGEADGSGNVARMVREFDINSEAELTAVHAKGEAANYMNLDLSYTPTSTPKALAQVMQVFGGGDRRISVKTMSEFKTTDLVGSHIIYLGYLSGMQSLTDLMFAASGLALGVTYDELINLDSNAIYESSSGLSIGEATYRDYGMLSAFPSPGGHQFVMLAGMRDEGLVNLSEEVTTPEKLATLEKALDPKGGAEPAFEALYEVLGYDNTNMDAKLVYSSPLDTTVLWDARLIGEP